MFFSRKTAAIIFLALSVASSATARSVNYLRPSLSARGLDFESASQPVLVRRTREADRQIEQAKIRASLNIGVNRHNEREGLVKQAQAAEMERQFHDQKYRSNVNKVQRYDAAKQSYQFQYRTMKAQGLSTPTHDKKKVKNKIKKIDRKRKAVAEKLPAIERERDEAESVRNQKLRSANLIQPGAWVGTLNADVGHDDVLRQNQATIRPDVYSYLPSDNHINNIIHPVPEGGH